MGSGPRGKLLISMAKLTIPADKFVIGLTGNIATGKSAVMQLAAQRGAFTIDADQVVHEILNHNTEVQEAIANAFGPAVLLENGRINRPALGKIVFNRCTGTTAIRAHRSSCFLHNSRKDHN